MSGPEEEAGDEEQLVAARLHRGDDSGQPRRRMSHPSVSIDPVIDLALDCATTCRPASSRGGGPGATSRRRGPRRPSAAPDTRRAARASFGASRIGAGTRSSSAGSSDACPDRVEPWPRRADRPPQRLGVVLGECAGVVGENLHLGEAASCEPSCQNSRTRSASSSRPSKTSASTGYFAVHGGSGGDESNHDRSLASEGAADTVGRSRSGNRGHIVNIGIRLY